MKRIYPAIAVAAAVLSFSSCTKDETIKNGDLQSGSIEITITGEMGGFDISTKAEVESVIRMKWNTTTDDGQKDVVWVYGNDSGTFTSLGSLKATSSESNPYTATLSGTIAVPSDNNIYLVLCPKGTYSQPEVTTGSSTGSITFDMSAEQGSDVTPFIIYSSVNVSGTELSDLTARFSFATTVVKVNLTGIDASTALTKATVSNVNKYCTLSFKDGSVTVADASASELGTFTKSLGGSATAKGKATFLLSVPALSANSERELTVTAGGKTYTEEGVFQSAHPANSYVNTICCVEPSVPQYPEAPELACVKIGDVWWAPVNCGYDATNYPYGKLYQWGRHDGCGYGSTWTDISSQTVAAEYVKQDSAQGPIAAGNESTSNFYKVKSDPYDWLSTQNNYRWSSATGDNDPSKTTQVTPIKTGYDPCPTGWRVPTYYELYQLNNAKMSTAFSTGDGTIKGYHFGTDGNNIFLPAAGFRDCYYGTAILRGDCGYYWCSSAFIDNRAWLLYFYSSIASMNSCNRRAHGFSVRCVQE